MFRLVSTEEKDGLEPAVSTSPMENLEPGGMKLGPQSGIG